MMDARKQTKSFADPYLFLRYSEAGADERADTFAGRPLSDLF